MALKRIATAVTRALEMQVRGSFKKSKRDQVVKLKRRLKDSDVPDGAHAIADLLREMICEAMTSAFSVVNVMAICEGTWKEMTSSSSALPIASSRSAEIEVTMVGERAAQMMDKE